MKNKKIVMALILVLAMLFIPNVYAAEDIVIKSITNAEKGGNAEFSNNNPTIEGLKIIFDKIVFKDKDDFVSYDVVISNESNEDYEISNKTVFSESEYFKYEFSFEGDSNIVPKKSEKTMKIKITYDKDVDASAFDDTGTFTEGNEMSVDLAAQPAKNTNNPSTGSGLIVALILVFLAAIASISMVLSSKTKLNKHLIMIIALSLAIIPVTIYAAKMVAFTLNTNIIIDKNYHFYFVDEETTCSGPGTNNLFDAVTFENSSVAEKVGEECVDGVIREEYKYTNSNLTWADILDEIDLEEDFLVDIFPKDSDTHVEMTDKIKHGETYIWLAE